jgi:hypothetical protein
VQGEISLSPTRDKSGRAFAPRDQKGDFQVSKRAGSICRQGEEDAKGEMGGLAINIIQSVTCMYLYLCAFVLIKVVFRLEINHVCEE